MKPNESDRFKKDYHKFADRQVDDRTFAEGIGRLRMAAFIAVVGPGATILLHVTKSEMTNFFRNGILVTIPLSILLLIINFIRLPGKAKGSPIAFSILLVTLAAAASTYPLLRAFFPVALPPVS